MVIYLIQELKHRYQWIHDCSDTASIETAAMCIAARHRSGVQRVLRLPVKIRSPRLEFNAMIAD